MPDKQYIEITIDPSKKWEAVSILIPRQEKLKTEGDKIYVEAKRAIFDALDFNDISYQPSRREVDKLLDQLDPKQDSDEDESLDDYIRKQLGRHFP